MAPGEIAGRTLGTGVTVPNGVADGVVGASDGGAGVEGGFFGDAVGEGDFFGDGLGDAFDFFFTGEAFAFFFFAAVGFFLGVGFFFLGDAFGFGAGDFFGVGDVVAVASGFSSDETCAETGMTARTLAISSDKQNRATAHVTTSQISGGLRRGSGICALLFTAKNRVQFSTQQQQQTGQVHPGQQNDNGGQRVIGGIIAIVFCHIELKQFRYRQPSDCKQNGTRQCLSHGEIIFRRQQIKAEGQDDQGDGSKRKVECCHPFLKRNP